MSIKKQYFSLFISCFIVLTYTQINTKTTRCKTEKKRGCCYPKVGPQGPQGPRGATGPSGLIGSYIQAYSYLKQTSADTGSFVTLENTASLSGWKITTQNTLSTIVPLTKNSTFAITYTVNIISGAPFYSFLSNSGSAIPGSQFSLTPLQIPAAVTITAYLSLNKGQTPSISLAYLGTIDPGVPYNQEIVGIATESWISTSISIVQIA